jgi:asparagine synthase (glutamine-hydrolysing)
MLLDGYTAEFQERLAFQEPIAWFESLLAGPGSLRARANHADLRSYLPFDLLTKVDIASMACSLECRCPLLDHELIEFALSLPDELRFPGGGKRILRDWARSRLPAEILDRPKMGFGVPIGLWFRGELKADLEEALFAPDAISTRIFRAEWLRRLFESHISGRENHEHRLWALLMLERWRRAWSPVLR